MLISRRKRPIKNEYNQKKLHAKSWGIWSKPFIVLFHHLICCSRSSIEFLYAWTAIFITVLWLQGFAKYPGFFFGIKIVFGHFITNIWCDWYSAECSIARPLYGIITLAITISTFHAIQTQYKRHLQLIKYVIKKEIPFPKLAHSATFLSVFLFHKNQYLVENNQETNEISRNLFINLLVRLECRIPLFTVRAFPLKKGGTPLTLTNRVAEIHPILTCKNVMFPHANSWIHSNLIMCFFVWNTIHKPY